MLKPLPSVSQASSMILQEEHQKEIRCSMPSHPGELSASGFFSQQNRQVVQSRQPSIVQSRLPQCHSLVQRRMRSLCRHLILR